MRSSREATDRLAFEQMVRATRDDLLAYAIRRAANAEDAADVLSETYLIAWRKLEKIPPGDSARLWLFGVAANVLRRGAQHHRSHAALLQRLTNETLRDGHIEATRHEDPMSAALRAGLASLRPRDRELLTLTAWEGLTPRQIAAVTGLPANLIRVRLHRARTRLKRRLSHTQTSTPDTQASMLPAKSSP